MKVIKEYSFYVPIAPTPASRPRVTRWGTFYLKKYEDFRTSCKHYLNSISKNYPVSNKMLSVHIEIVCLKPKKPSHLYPYRGDLDNFYKGVLDCITQAGMVWEDDAQVVELNGIKRYQQVDEQSGFKVTVKELE